MIIELLRIVEFEYNVILKLFTPVTSIGADSYCHHSRRHVFPYDTKQPLDMFEWNLVEG